MCVSPVISFHKLCRRWNLKERLNKDYITELMLDPDSDSDLSD